jgi:predicted DNA-binding transcriptional regulator AlpA
MEDSTQTQYLTEKEVSGICKLALPTLRNYRHQGKGPSYVKVGRAVRYLMSDIVKYMEQGRVNHGQ